MNTQQNPEPQTQEKTPYQAPEIIDYGDIETLTQIGGGNVADVDGGISAVP